MSLFHDFVELVAFSFISGVSSLHQVDGFGDPPGEVLQGLGQLPTVQSLVTTEQPEMCNMTINDFWYEHWSLITGRGWGGYKTEGGEGGGASEVLPLQKKMGGNSFSHSEGGAPKVLG